VVTDVRRVRIASRGSRLALWQAGSVRDQLLEAHPDLEVAIEIVQTTGDRILDVPLARIGDRGLFTKEIDDALLDGRADLAVHSLKDVPTQLPAGLRLAAVGEREDARDVLLGPRGAQIALEDLPAGARVGTSSLRRRAQLHHLRGDLQVLDIRGNLDTRLARLDAGDYDALVLAAAGVLRLGLGERIAQFLPVERWLPAVGQGALAMVSRVDDPKTRELLRPLHHAATAAAVTAERSFLAVLEGGCQVPIGAFATLRDERLVLDGLVSDLEGALVLRDSRAGSPADAGAIGTALGVHLLERGAGAILRAIRREAAAPAIPAP
jgi:hydroxymethylbilane synthase